MDDGILFQILRIISPFVRKIKTQNERRSIMVEQDTIKLLRECDAGVKMGVDSIESVMPYTRSTELKKQLAACVPVFVA